jgi:hypothetical protein
VGKRFQQRGGREAHREIGPRWHTRAGGGRLCCVVQAIEESGVQVVEEHNLGVQLGEVTANRLGVRGGRSTRRRPHSGVNGAEFGSGIPHGGWLGSRTAPAQQRRGRVEALLECLLDVAA